MTRVPAMDQDEHVKLLGEGAGRSQQLELCTAQLLARALQVPESTARLLATKMGKLRSCRCSRNSLVAGSAVR
jgi:hypothetical protein